MAPGPGGRVMLAHGAGFKLLDVLLEVGLEGATREHLVHKAGISPTTFYKGLRPMLEAGLVQEQGGRFVLPLDHPYNFRLKCWRDFDRLYDLKEQDRSAVLRVRAEAQAEVKDELLSLWLIGSAAHEGLRPGSDLDFLALTRTGESSFSPRAHREIQWVEMSPEEFEERFLEGDEFASSALRYGILLHDLGQARRLYGIPPRPPSLRAFRDKGLTVENFRRRFFFLLDNDEPDEAMTPLASLAQTMVRSMLQRLGETPAGKPDVLAAGERILGAAVTREFRTALERQAPKKKKDLVVFHRRLSDYYGRFTENAEHLEHTTEALVRGQSAEFEAAAREVLTEILGPEVQLRRADHPGEGDLWIQLPRHPELVVEVKSLSGAAQAQQVRQVAAQVERHSQRTGTVARGLLLLNPFRDVPLLERPALEEDLWSEAEALSVKILTSLELVQAHHSLHLEDDPRKAFALLNLPRLEEEATPDLKVTVEELSGQIERQLRRIVAARGWLDQSQQILAPGLELSVQNLYHKSGEPLSSVLQAAVGTFTEVHRSVLRGESVRKSRLARAVGCGLDLLRNLESFPRGVYTVVEPGVELFSDPQALHRRTDVAGVLIEVSGADVPSLRVFPTTRTYERGQKLGWEWNPKKVWGETWCRDPGGQIQYAWTESMEFVGRPLSEL